MADRTEAQYRHQQARCRSLFEQKAADYGASWTILRPSSATDQIFIKAKRIRTIQQSGENRVGDSIEGEFIGIINYCAMALILLDEQHAQAFAEQEYRPPLTEVMRLYDEQLNAAYTTMQAKNHDYGEAWRDMRVSSFVDLILMKLLRIKQIEDNAGLTRVSEGIDAGYVDIINYAIFGLIQLSEQHPHPTDD